MTAGMTLAFGTYADAKKMEGFEQEVRHAEVPVSQAMIAFFCSSIEDGNASYWDPEFARHCWGSLVAPPAMVNVWMMPLPWRPQGADLRPSIALSVPLPGSVLINVGIDVEFERHVRLGDCLHSIERVDRIGPEKRTRLGVGHFIDSSARIYNQDGELVATHKNTLFRYEPEAAESV